MSPPKAERSTTLTTETSAQLSVARQRITQIVEGWFLTEPLLFAAWTMHDVIEQPKIATIRVGKGKIEFNPDFIDSLRKQELRGVLSFEALRILLGHPYSRRKPNAELSYQASNVTVQECLRTSLPVPRARDLWNDPDFDDQYFEFYYRELDERSVDEDSKGGQDNSSGDNNPSSEGSQQPQSDQNEDSGPQNEQDSTEIASDLDAYCDEKRSGIENTETWDNDDLQRDEIQFAVQEAAASEGWGTIGGAAKERLLANRSPQLDYRGVLKQFRQNILSINRRLTRMKPSRRYGFDQMGSRYEFTTKLLFAVDVSGSMTHRDLQLGFSVVSRFFRYGVEAIDVIWFDERIRSEPLQLRRARQNFEVTGRGGTNFTPVIEFIDRHRDYDGLIIFTDGYAPAPRKPQNQRTKILWLLKDESTYEQMRGPLQRIGSTAYLRS